ncbi:MAG: aldo/keto reductase [Proteobacteria bacterium]|nr:aldo/keto reductase [Pseudomonadota bacterium]
MFRLSRREFLAGTAAAGMLKAGGLTLADDRPMLHRSIPGSAEQLPIIGLGTARVFNVDDSPELLAPLRAVLKELLDGGGSVIDTAPSYGMAERVVGDLVTGLESGKVFLATKVAANGKEAGLRQIQNSFKDLRTGIVDLYQVHNLRDTKQQLGLLRELQAEGKIRYIGITHYVDSQHDELVDWVRREPMDFLQFNYSIAGRTAEQTLLPLCEDMGVATMINRPFKRGRLFRGVKGKALPEWAADFDCHSWGQFFLKYIAANPAVTNIIPATANPKHMLDNIQAGKGRLPDARQRAKMIQFIDNL